MLSSLLSQRKPSSRQEIGQTARAIALAPNARDVWLQSMQDQLLLSLKDCHKASRTLWPALRVAPGMDAEARGGNPLLLPALLAVYIAAMMVFAVFVRGWSPIHADSSEMAAWGQVFQWGYSKHPPLGPWIAGAWFTIMPHANWSFDLLATLVTAFGLVGIWKTAGLYLDEGGQRLSILLPLLTPAFTTWAFKYNANSILLGVWPWAIYFCLRMIETRSVAAAAMAGIFAGLSLLGKYYSAVLCATLLLVLLVHPARDRVLRSAAPYVAILAGLLVIAPHVWWVLDSNASTVMYALEKTQRDVSAARLTTLRSVAAGLLTLVPPAVLLAVAYRDDAKGLVARMRAGLQDPPRRWVFVLAWGPLFFTMVAHFVFNVRIGGDFLLPAFIAVPFAFLVQIGAPVEARVVRRVTGGVLGILAIVALMSPLIGALTFYNARHPMLEPRAELAAAATDFWRGSMNTPLRRVAGQERPATGIAFYSEDHPLYMDGGIAFSLDRNDPDIVRNGLLFVCGQDDGACMGNSRRVLGEDGYKRFTYTGSHRVFGYSGPMYTFELFLLPPQH